MLSLFRRLMKNQEGAAVVEFTLIVSLIAVAAIALIALLGPSQRNVVIVIAIAFAPVYGRVSRALVLRTRQEQFIEAERALGAGSLRIVSGHVLPTILPPLVILLAMDIPSAIAVEAGLSFLGAGVPPDVPSWGIILNDGFVVVRQSPWPVVGASVAIGVTTLGFTLLGEALRDATDPRLARLNRWRFR